MSELWFKNEKVLTLKETGEVFQVVNIDNPELLPFCLRKECTTELFMDWLKKRGIPDTREGVSQVTEAFGKTWRDNKNYASLTDQYWIKRRTEEWKKINFFTNLYCTDIGDMFFSPWLLNKNKFNNGAVGSPDLTTNGILRKRWVQNSDKTSSLIKAGSVAAKQDPLNEVLVSVLVEKLEKINAASYSLCIEGTTMCCKCDNFITANTSFVPASYIYYSEEREEKDSVLCHLLKMCEKYKIPNVEEFLEWMIFVDSITGNDDRNLSNIGFILDADKNEFIGPAPLFDNGGAYWDSKKVSDAVKSKLFGDEEDAIIKKLTKETDLEEILKNTDYVNLISNYPEITDVKKDNLIEAIRKRHKSISVLKNLNINNER